MAKSDEVEFNGVVFRRYPDSNNRADREYYRASGSDIEDGVESLHREVWKHHNGEIPDGCLIHHVDGDATNNDISNLECVTPEEHARRHPEMGNASEEHIERIVELAKDWHRSEEGKEWHRQHWEESLAKAFEDTRKECEQCGDEYTDRSPHDVGRFCSGACKSKWRRESGRDDEERVCRACRQTFEANKYSNRKSCSRRCGGALTSWSKRVQSDG